jgi:pyruvate/2-oxoglutarate dehydrogenase complex dihydrolipoamide acyltransferase (E2) component
VVDSGIITAILSTAGSGTALIVVLIVLGILRTAQEAKRLEKDAADWQAAYQAERTARETERKTGDELRATVLAQTERADAAVETAKLARELLEDLRRRTDAPA